MKEYFIKTFDKKEYADAFCEKGELLFRHLNYFRKLEGDDVRCDESEGSHEAKFAANIPSHVTKIEFRSPAGGKRYVLDYARFKKDHNIDDTRGDVEITMQYIVDYLIYSMTYVAEDTENKPTIFREIQKFGRYSVAVECGEFLSKLRQAIPDVSCGLVKYSVSPQKNNILEKDAKYSGENEFRVVIQANLMEQKKIMVGKLHGTMFDNKALERCSDLLFKETKQ